MSLLRYITHPNIEIDPAVPVPEWRLSEEGRRRLQLMFAQPWVPSITRIVSSTETKAIQAALMLGDHLELEIEQRPQTGETDRSATGFVPHVEHEALADRFFAEPTRSASGWERAIDAQTRIVDAVADLLADDDGQPEGDVAVIGHGGVGTLFYCHLAGLAIDRRHDQPGQGHYWTLDRRSGEIIHPWLPIAAV